MIPLQGEKYEKDQGGQEVPESRRESRWESRWESFVLQAWPVAAVPETVVVVRTTMPGAQGAAVFGARPG